MLPDVRQVVETHIFPDVLIARVDSKWVFSCCFLVFASSYGSSEGFFNKDFTNDVLKSEGTALM